MAAAGSGGGDRAARPLENFRRHVPEFLRFVLSQGGRTIAQMRQDGREARMAPDDASQSRYRDKPVWHNRTDLIGHLATELKVSRRYWGPQRTSSDFYDVVDQELAKLRRKKIIVGWNAAGRGGVFRLQKQQYRLDTKPIATLGDVGGSSRTADAVAVQHSIPHQGEGGSGVDDMRKIFVSILTRGGKANTYKFALARALLEYSRNAKPRAGAVSYEVPYDYLADRFLEYYWHQECKFRIKQDFQATGVPNAIRAIQDAFGGDKQFGDFSDVSEDKKRQAKRDILRNVFGNARSGTSMVVPRFQKIREGRYAVDRNVFYTHSDDEKMIYLRSEAFEFFRRNNSILSMAVLAEWAKFLERINGSLPRLVAKIEHDRTQRGSLNGFRKAYCAHMDHCFYCSDRLEQDYTHVDHFLPWSYIFEDEAWNLVLACQDCNCKKSDSLPQEEFQDELIKRNGLYRKRIQILDRSLMLINTKLGWKREIQNHYTICQEYGFNVIKMP